MVVVLESVVVPEVGWTPTAVLVLDEEAGVLAGSDGLNPLFGSSGLDVLCGTVEVSSDVTPAPPGSLVDGLPCLTPEPVLCWPESEGLLTWGRVIVDRTSVVPTVVVEIAEIAGDDATVIKGEDDSGRVEILSDVVVGRVGLLVTAVVGGGSASSSPGFVILNFLVKTPRRMHMHITNSHELP